LAQKGFSIPTKIPSKAWCFKHVQAMPFVKPKKEVAASPTGQDGCSVFRAMKDQLNSFSAWPSSELLHRAGKSPGNQPTTPVPQGWN